MKLIKEHSVLLDPQNIHMSVLGMRQVVMERLKGGGTTTTTMAVKASGSARRPRAKKKC
jgi:hypothetical protein